MNTKTVTCAAFTKAVDSNARTVEQIVSVFGNVDLGGDRVVLGAFEDTIKEWLSGPNTLSAYFSHQWDNPFANIGGVIAAEELAPGDVRLPNDQVVTEDGKTLRDLGGLLVKYKFDPEGKNSFADQVFWLLDERRIVQASFAYDVIDSKRNSDGTKDLVKLALHEVGPTLLGMNPATTLLTSSRKSIEELAKTSGLSEEQVKSVLDAASKDAGHTFIGSEEDATKCMICGRGQTAVAHINRLSTESEMKTVSFAGSAEERQQALYELVRSWARDGDIGTGGFYSVYLEATYEDRAIFLVEGWEDPIGEGIYYEAAVTNNDDGTFSISEPTEVIVEQTVRPKARRKLLDSTTAQKQAANIPAQDDEGITNDDPEAGNSNGKSSEIGSTSEAKQLREQADVLMLDAL